MPNKIKIEKANVHPFDVEELAAYISRLDYDEIDANTEIIEEALMERFGCDLGQFGDIICRLLPLIEIAKSPITDETYKGFAITKEQRWLIKTAI